MLARAVAGASQKWRQARQAFNDNNASPPCNQTVDRRFGAVQGSEKINLHNLAINADLCLYKSAALGNSGIVDKKVDAAVACDEFPDGRIAVALIDNVAINATPAASLSNSPILAPARENRRQTAAPMPLAAPVTTTTLSFILTPDT
jgi:hypothetical protein